MSLSPEPPGSHRRTHHRRHYRSTDTARDWPTDGSGNEGAYTPPSPSMPEPFVFTPPPPPHTEESPTSTFEELPPTQMEEQLPQMASAATQTFGGGGIGGGGGGFASDSSSNTSPTVAAAAAAIAAASLEDVAPLTAAATTEDVFSPRPRMGGASVHRRRMVAAASSQAAKHARPPRKGPWSQEEDALLAGLVERYGAKDWSFIASHIPGRIGKQCRERYHNHLAPAVKKDAWSAEEDEAIIQAHSIYGNKWTDIARLLGNGRPPNAIKNRWNSALKRRVSEASPVASSAPPAPAPAPSPSSHTGPVPRIVIVPPEAEESGAEARLTPFAESAPPRYDHVVVEDYSTSSGSDANTSSGERRKAGPFLDGAMLRPPKRREKPQSDDDALAAASSSYQSEGSEGWMSEPALMGSFASPLFPMPPFSLASRLPRYRPRAHMSSGSGSGSSGSSSGSDREQKLATSVDMQVLPPLEALQQQQQATNVLELQLRLQFQQHIQLQREVEAQREQIRVQQEQIAQQQRTIAQHLRTQQDQPLPQQQQQQQQQQQPQQPLQQPAPTSAFPPLRDLSMSNDDGVVYGGPAPSLFSSSLTDLPPMQPPSLSSSLDQPAAPAATPSTLAMSITPSPPLHGDSPPDFMH